MNVEEAGGLPAIVAIGRAVELREPVLFHQRHHHIGAGHHRGEHDGEDRVGADAEADKPDDRGRVLRVAAEAIEAARHQPVGAAIGVAEAEIEIAADGDEETDQPKRQTRNEAGPIEQGRRVPVEHRDHEGQHHAAAEQSPKGQALPAAGLGCRPDAEGRSKQGAQQKKVERNAGGETGRKDQTGEGQIDHGARAKKQIRFADLRQRADGSVSLLKSV